MKRNAIVLAGLMSLFAALPAGAQSINSNFPGGSDIMDTLPSGAITTLPATQFTNLWARTLGFLNILFGVGDSTTVPVITAIPGTDEAVIVPISGPVIAPYPEQKGQASRLVDYPSMRRLYP